MFNCHNFTYSMEAGQMGNTEKAVLKLFNRQNRPQKKDIPILWGYLVYFLNERLLFFNQ